MENESTSENQKTKYPGSNDSQISQLRSLFSAFYSTRVIIVLSRVNAPSIMVDLSRKLLSLATSHPNDSVLSRPALTI